MSDYKDIEKLYREYSESHEVTPPPDVWSRIESSLDKKQREKRIVWLRIAGVAASLLFMVSLTTWLWMSDISTQNSLSENTPITNENTEIKNSQQQPSNTVNSNANLDNEKNLTVSDKKDNIAYLPINKRTDADIIDTNNNDRGNSERDESVSHVRLNNDAVVSGYFTTDKIEIKKLKKEYPDLILAGNYGVNTPFDPFPNVAPKKNRPKIEIGGAYSPVYSFRQTPENNPSTFQSMDMSNKMATPNEKGVLYGGGGLNISMKMNKKWSVESGVRYARMGQKVSPDANGDMYANMDFLYSNPNNNILRQITLNNSMGNINIDNGMGIIYLFNSESPNNDSKRALSQMYSFDNEGTINLLELNVDYLEVPLTMRYYIVDNKISLSMLAGVSANFLINNNAYLLFDDIKEKIGEVSDISGLSMSTHAGLSISVPIAGKLSLQVEPRVNYFVSNINKSNYQYRPYSFGVFSGIKYKFGK